MSTLCGWGRYPRFASEAIETRDAAGLPALVAGRAGVIARGGGRAYGDAAVGARVTLMTGGLDRMRAFDPVSGRIEVEAGVRLADIVAAFVPRGWFPPVVPGTQGVTVGGMIAADVHGKNHHRDGGFGDHLERLDLLLPDGARATCSPLERPDLFAATVGGMGLTGTILAAAFRLRPIGTGWIRQETAASDDLAGTLRALAADGDATYSVAWVDGLARGAGLGRGLVYRGEHATRADLAALGPGLPAFPAPRRGTVRVPAGLPPWILNRGSVAAFNALYRRRGMARAGTPELVGLAPYFFPLDGLADWNRLYGARGFVQHQCVIPTARAEPVLAEILDRVARLGAASPLAVLKQLGPGRRAMSSPMSFPMPGYTLALDLPARPDALALLDDVDRLVAAAGGRLYLAKDARQSRETFEAGHPGLPAFRALRRGIGAEGRLASRLSARLGI